MPDINRLFVYGSLQPGHPNAHRLEAIGGRWMKASIRGTLLEKGWGTEIGFPGLCLNPAGQKVEGYVFESPLLEKLWRQLDQFEGDDYRRVLSLVELEDGKSIEAYVYVIHQQQNECGEQ